MRDLVLIVDDVEINRLILSEILADKYDIAVAADGREALDYLYGDNTLPSAILLDIVMPEMDGFEVLEQIRSKELTRKIPVLIITASESSENETRGLKSGAQDYILKPFNAEVVRTRIDASLKLHKYQHQLEQMVEEKTNEVTQVYNHTLSVLASIIEYRDLESGAHVHRTSLLADAFFEQMMKMDKFENAIPCSQKKQFVLATELHDIGKIGIPDSILLKPGRLEEDEFNIIKTHTTLGGSVVDRIAEGLNDSDMYMKFCKEICLHHHERWDGKGYPMELAGEDIPISARIMALIDVFDALVNARVYKPAFSYEEAIKIIVEGAGTQFDPNLMEVFQAATDIFIAIEMENQD